MKEELIKLWQLVTMKYPHGDFPTEPMISFDGKNFFHILVCPVMTKNRATICLTARGETNPARTFKIDSKGEYTESNEIALSNSEAAQSLASIPGKVLVELATTILLFGVKDK